MSMQFCTFQRLCHCSQYRVIGSCLDREVHKGILIVFLQKAMFFIKRVLHSIFFNAEWRVESWGHIL